MHRRVVTLACTILAAAAAVAVAPPAADAQRVIVRRGATPPRTTARTPAPRPTPAQRARVVQQRRAELVPGRTLTLSVGALRYEPDGDDNHPMAALRADWRLRRWLFSELGVSYALADLSMPATATLPAEDVNSSLATATVGLRAELPWPYLRPYVGAAAGLFARFDGETDDRESDSFVRPTVAFPVGVRIPFSPQLALRAEARFRFDEHRDGASVPNVEQTVGLSFRF